MQGIRKPEARSTPAKIRHIRVDLRAIGTHDRPVMDADSAELRG